MQTKVKDILTKKGGDIITVQKNDSVADVVSILNEKHIGAVIVKDGETVVGILSERDLLKKLLPECKCASEIKAGEIMTDHLVITTVETSIEECMTVMTEKRIRHLPVFDGKDLVGIISIGDLMKNIVQEKSAQVNYLHDYIAGALG
jgi:CBS domain-containing protein